MSTYAATMLHRQPKPARPRPLVRVRLQLPSDPWNGADSETLWAEKVVGNIFRLANIPFIALGASRNDLVMAEPRGTELEAKHVAYRGGHSTYRIMLSAESTPFDTQCYWRSLASLGCTYEEGPALLWAVDIQPEADFGRVYLLLDRGERAQIWHFEEGHCEHSLVGSA